MSSSPAVLPIIRVQYSRVQYDPEPTFSDLEELYTRAGLLGTMPRCIINGGTTPYFTRDSRVGASMVHSAGGILQNLPLHDKNSVEQKSRLEARSRGQSWGRTVHPHPPRCASYLIVFSYCQM